LFALRFAAAARSLHGWGHLLPPVPAARVMRSTWYKVNSFFVRVDPDWNPY
jgi:hypothetical protein